MSSPSDRRYSLDELCLLVEMSKRTIRFYIQQGLVDRPTGETRAAYYTERHLQQLLTVKKWSQVGLSLDRIREVMAEPNVAEIPARPRGRGTVEVWSHLVIAEGVELTIEPARAGLTPEQVRALFQQVLNAFEDIHTGD